MRLTTLLILGLALAARPGAAATPAVQYPETRQLVDRVAAAAELFAKDGHAACAAFKESGGEWFHGDVYVFVVDFGGNALCHPAQPALEGLPLLELHDADGRPIMELMLRQLRGGGAHGWVHYLWPRPGESVQSWKSTYLRRAVCPEHGDDVIVASGAYNLPLEKLFVVDRVEEAARLLARDGRAAFDVLRRRDGGFIFYDAYVFVMSLAGTMLVNPFSPELEGRGVLDVRDTQGIYPGREMLALLAAAEAGWVEYFWPRPGAAAPTFKETYVRRVDVDGEPLVVGAGVYVD